MENRLYFGKWLWLLYKEHHEKTKLETRRSNHVWIWPVGNLAPGAALEQDGMEEMDLRTLHLATDLLYQKLVSFRISNGRLAWCT